ncbi:hypothetical protein OG754_34850 [Streptomyces decoyicus]|uniref:hypothetical protein n=1 Tax=Streptomyces decoyicus TaxID=249567 RepID=UPI002E2F6E42|nr:hypothetical protein [Streptomyces decoyicus]
MHVRQGRPALPVPLGTVNSGQSAGMLLPLVEEAIDAGVAGVGDRPVFTRPLF